MSNEDTYKGSCVREPVALLWYPASQPPEPTEDMGGVWRSESVLVLGEDGERYLGFYQSYKHEDEEDDNRWYQVGPGAFCIDSPLWWTPWPSFGGAVARQGERPPPDVPDFYNQRLGETYGSEC